MSNHLIISVDELWLKGKNRPKYYQAIISHVKDVLKAYHEDKSQVLNEHQSLVVRSETEFNDDTILALQKVPGIYSLVPTRAIAPVYEDILPAVINNLELLPTLPSTFKVHTKRTDKNFPMNSMEVSRQIGGGILQHFSSLKVDVHQPELMVEIRIMNKNIHIFSSANKRLGIGGLPVGTSGHLVTMLSGGFDSPVASYLMSKRGCRQTFVFFHAYPFVGDEVKDKIIKLMEVLGRYQKYCNLYVVPFGNIQELIAENCFPEYRTLLFRKFMLDCSNLLATRVKAEALLTGDALGQVSSQTIGNIAALDNMSPHPIFRPLLGYNKTEIIELSKKIGTHDISVVPHDDACGLFAPKHPVTRPDRFYFDKFCNENTFHEEIEKCLDEAEKYSVNLSGACRLFDSEKV